MHFATTFLTERRKVKYASEMPIFEIALVRNGTKTKKGPQGLSRSVMK
jgi:hypothetical protein